MKTPENINKFLDEMDTIRQNRGKAAHLLFNDIESDLIEKEDFLQD